MKNFEFSVVVASCNAYSDLWEPCFYFLNKYLLNKDVNFKVYLITDVHNDVLYTPNYSFLTVLTPENPNVSWSSLQKECLLKINEKYILFLQEDFLLTQTVNIEKLNEFFNILKNHPNSGMIKLVPCPAPASITIPDLLGEVTESQEYRISCQAGIWRKDYLLSILKDGESPWEFERNGTQRSLNFPEKILSVTRANRIIHYTNDTAIVNRLWTRDAVKHCKSHGINLDLKYRGVATKWRVYYKVKAPLLVRHLMDFINCRMIKYLNIDLNISRKY